MAETIQSPVTAPTPRGYPSLAEQIGNHSRLAAFRSFAGLNARNILYFQAELLELESALGEVEKTDQALCQTGERDSYATSWFQLSENGRNDPNKEQLRLVRRLRELLYEYSQYISQA